MLNALTIDVEDYFHVSAFDSPEKRRQWDTLESRVCRNTDRILDLLAESSTTATFFVLGWVAEQFPWLAQRIAREGHEVASHGYAHRLVYDLTPQEFRDDLRRAKDAIGAATGIEVRGYRAPSFSITERSLWALEVLVEEGYTFDSSVYPICRDRYGIPGAPRHAHQRSTPSGSLLEIPPSTVRWGGFTVPVAGGGYFRLYPYAFTRQAVLELNLRERQPAVVYLHPWEIDPRQPRQAGNYLNRFRHYVNLDRTESRLQVLLRDFTFGPLTSAALAVAGLPQLALAPEPLAAAQRGSRVHSAAGAHAW
jgi:polysaccharide deacetylase family protein (PEP-CTERM system associated)